MYDVAFPNFGIYIEKMVSSFDIGNFTIAYYGVIISIGMIIGFMSVLFFAKKSKQNEDRYYDLFIIIIISSIIGARLYYVLFNLDFYTKYPKEIINLRAGGLAIYGGVIFGMIATFIYSKVAKISFFRLVDTAVIGVSIGQAIGRWGNFVNLEAFGDYTNNFFAMQIKKDLVSDSAITMNMLYHLVHNGDTTYIQVHPTFLYESIGCLVLFIVLIFAFTRKKKDGIVFATYLIGYGIIRFFIEALRTDSLFIPNSSIRISQVVSVIAIIVGILIILLAPKVLEAEKPTRKELKEIEKKNKEEQKEDSNTEDINDSSIS